jgi:hypothetical protein
VIDVGQAQVAEAMACSSTRRRRWNGYSAGDDASSLTLWSANSASVTAVTHVGERRQFVGGARTRT